MARDGTLNRLWLRTVRIASVVLAGLATAALLGSAQHAMPMEREPQMRVLLHEGPKLLLRADKEQWMQVRGLGAGVRRLRRLQLEQSGGSVVAVLDGRRRRLSSATVLTVQNDDPRGIWLDSRRYRGEFQISCRGGRLRVVNALGIETYLTSVVGSEMPHHWPLAALKAQAVAARTYALRQRSRGGGWDVKATVASQVYRGVEAETASTRQAVADTRSLVLVHRGKLINAVFHSSSGGVTESSGMVWSRQLPYLVSVPDHDQHSPVHRWQERFGSQGLRQRLPETGGVNRVDVTSRSASGRVRQARLEGPRGSLVLTGRELRQRLDLKSTLVTFEMVSAATAQPPQPSTVLARRTTATSGSRSRIDRVTASVASSAPTASLPSAALLVAPPPPLLSRPMRSRSFRFRATRSKDRRVPAVGGLQLLVRGQGYGHGVGMSQWGAHGLAGQGADFRTILRHYYRGADVLPFQPHYDPALAWLPRPASGWWG
ncbi:MAG: SpoIID/LytB domain-containing protein [Synechococcus sp. BS30m-G31]|nr:SpoIID/LytB domain-containing protein [Synechococcus sp. BS30m-G31]